MLRLHSDSEHELTDPLTSLCCLGFQLHLFCGAQFLYGDQTRPSVGVQSKHSGTFCFLPSVPEVFTGRRQCRQSFKSFGACDSNICCQRRGRRLVLCWEVEKASLLEHVLTSPLPICQSTTSRGKHSELGVD